ncbi:MAG: M23 family metallopeptidase [Treponema sp.]|nr:M23 family metallopeptidase [Treponema sp.]
MNFDHIGKQHVSKRPKPSPLKEKKYSPSSFDTRFSQQVWPRTKNARDSANVRNRKMSRERQGRSSGFSIPLSWLKKLAVVAGVLVIGVVGTNWDGIAERIGWNDYNVKPEQDSGALGIIEAGYQPVFSAPAYSDAPLDVTETFTWSEYTIKDGDTISGIASKFPVSAESIIAYNNIKESWNIRKGTVLKIPNMDGVPYTVGKNDSISKIAIKMKVPQNAILDANNILSETIHPGDVLFIPGARMDSNEFNMAFRRDAARKPAQKPMIIPVSGRITSNYGWRQDPVNPVPGRERFHHGVDFIGRTGDPIKAAMKGSVLHIDNNPTFGNFIILQHNDGYQTLYAHLSAYTVRKGDEVKQGQEIGKIGATGYTTGPHLHFEAFRNGNRINPLDLIK